MKIIETMVLSQNQRIFEDLGKNLSLSYVDTLELPVYRLELDPQLVILFYVITPELKVNKLLFDSIIPHITCVLLVSNRDSYDKLRFPENIAEDAEALLDSVVSVIAFEDGENWEEQLPDYINKEGLYLGEQGRLLFWNKEDVENTGRIWKVAFGKLLQ